MEGIKFISRIRGKEKTFKKNSIKIIQKHLKSFYYNTNPICTR